MAKPGPKPQPYLQVVREGNPSRKPIRTGAMVVSGELLEPDWSLPFPVVTAGRRPAAPRLRKDETPERFEQREADHAGALARWERMREAAAGASWCAARAAVEWRRVVPVLVRSCGLADVDEFVVRDYCICLARIDQGERALSRDGLLMRGERGWTKSGWTTVLGQYRTQLSRYVRELGLSPASRPRSPLPFLGGHDEDDEDPFD